MALTATQLKQIIKKEISKVLNEEKESSFSHVKKEKLYNKYTGLKEELRDIEDELKELKKKLKTVPASQHTKMEKQIENLETKAMTKYDAVENAKHEYQAYKP